MSDLISRQDALNAFAKKWKQMPFASDTFNLYDIEKILHDLPSAQPEQDREFIKLTVRNSNGRPYYSIIYLEVDDNGVGHDFEGYSSYSLDVISDYLKKYFMPSAHPEPKKGKWMPGVSLWYCSECGSSYSYNDYTFCPNCGARMKGSD